MRSLPAGPGSTDIRSQELAKRASGSMAATQRTSYFVFHYFQNQDATDPDVVAAYFAVTRAFASFTAVSSASAAGTFTSGSTPIPSQSALPKGLIALSSGMPMPK